MINTFSMNPRDSGLMEQTVGELARLYGGRLAHESFQTMLGEGALVLVGDAPIASVVETSATIGHENARHFA